MQIRSLIFAITLLAAPSAWGQNFFSANVHALHEPDGMSTLTAEYAWRDDRWSGFGFVDAYSEGGLEYFTNHAIDYTVSGSLYLSGEAGLSNFGETFKGGVGWRFGVPGMRFVNATAYPFVTEDAGDRPQLKLSWMTQEVRITDRWSVYGSGFARFRDDAPDVSQSQVWFAREGWQIEPGLEVGTFGDDTTFQLAVKLNLR